ncbi:hypothetical protein T484DRAFT_1835443 [Baffinella frigidus]|nr:hypothetical protein T484DRAFT_1835443 [Cryptophyta sp. CCMP2293]
MASKDEGDTALTVEEVPAELDAVEPASLAGRGQGMVARRDIAAGEALVSETALASIVFDEWGHLVCHQCFAALPLSKDKKIPCGGCLMVCYCSEGCQAAAAPLHDSECAALARLDTDILNPAEASSARLFVKLLCRRADELADAEGDGGSAVQACLDALVTNEEAMSDERMIELEMVVEAVNEAVGRDAEMDGDALLGYLCAAQCNSFSIWASGRGRPP